MRRPVLFTLLASGAILGLLLLGNFQREEPFLETPSEQNTVDAEESAAIDTADTAKAPVPDEALSPETTIANSGNVLATFPTLRGAIVNILCVSTDTRIRSMSGSGVIVSPNGTILTVAHVAQYFLLQDTLPEGTISCTIRTGSPATDTYIGKALFVSSAWILANKTALTATSPVGTGENDFALIGITGSTKNTHLLSSIPSIPLARRDPLLQEKTVIGSYGAEFIPSKDIRLGLSPILDFATISDQFTFQKTTVDLLSLKNSTAAQEGSSGGAVADGYGEVIGIITTSSSGSDIGKRTLNAITANYIRRAFLQETGASLDSYIQSPDTSSLVDAYAEQKEILAETLLKDL